ncbi:MAG: glutamate racemase [Patescibacteria group bacterium]|nr:glutamate racemase [Patescibacteria group bacterium]
MLGIFDSGVGGLTVAKEIKKLAPHQRIIYFGDTARVPWGNKSKETIRKYSEDIVRFLVSKGSKRIVIACNTASALTREYLQERYPLTIFYDVIDPCVKRIRAEKIGKVLIIGTKATIKSKAYEYPLREFLPGVKIYSQACPLFVPFIEEGLQEDELLREITKKYLSRFVKKNVECIILGCTHYPLMKNIIKEVFKGKVKIINAAYEIALQVKDDCHEKHSDDDDIFYFSDWSGHNESFVKNIMGGRPNIQIHRFD